MAQYTHRLFGMFDGEVRNVELLCDNSMTDVAYVECVRQIFQITVNNGKLLHRRHGTNLRPVRNGMSDTKIVVLCGAGAELSEPFKLSPGDQFAKKIVSKNNVAMEEAIEAFYSNVPDWYPEFSNVTIQEDDLFEAAVKKAVLDDWDALGKDKTAFNAEIKKRCAEESGKEKAEKDKFLSKYMTYAGVLDSKFYALANPRVFGPKDFWTVINCYTRAYLLLCSEIINGSETETTTEQYLQYLKEPVQTFNEMKVKVREKHNMHLATGKKSYYSIIGKKLIEDKSSISVITCNYTPICEAILEECTRCFPIFYIHGKLGVFENPYTMQIKDFTSQEAINEHQKISDPSGELWFPFMLLQSGTKPIIAQWQIEQYAGMYSKLNAADRLVILGYNINSDDGDVTSAIINFLSRRGTKQLVFLDFGGDIGEEKVKRRLRYDEDQKYNCELLYVPINSDNAYSIFEKCLQPDKLCKEDLLS